MKSKRVVFSGVRLSFYRFGFNGSFLGRFGRQRWNGRIESFRSIYGSTGRISTFAARKKCYSSPPCLPVCSTDRSTVSRALGSRFGAVSDEISGVPYSTVGILLCRMLRVSLPVPVPVCYALACMHGCNMEQHGRRHITHHTSLPR
jgi:hypothetical protein